MVAVVGDGLKWKSGTARRREEGEEQEEEEVGAYDCVDVAGFRLSWRRDPGLHEMTGIRDPSLYDFGSRADSALFSLLSRCHLLRTSLRDDVCDGSNIRKVVRLQRIKFPQTASDGAGLYRIGTSHIEQIFPPQAFARLLRGVDVSYERVALR